MAEVETVVRRLKALIQERFDAKKREKAEMWLQNVKSLSTWKLCPSPIPETCTVECKTLRSYSWSKSHSSCSPCQEQRQVVCTVRLLAHSARCIRQRLKSIGCESEALDFQSFLHLYSFSLRWFGVKLVVMLRFCAGIFVDALWWRRGCGENSRKSETGGLCGRTSAKVFVRKLFLK